MIETKGFTCRTSRLGTKEGSWLWNLRLKDSPLPRLLSTKDASTINNTSISIEQRESWKPDSARQIATNVPSCLSIVRVVALSWVHVGDGRLVVWYVPVSFKT